MKATIKTCIKKGSQEDNSVCSLDLSEVREIIAGLIVEIMQDKEKVLIVNIKS